MRDVDTLALDTIYFSTFFGGSGEDWAPTADEVVDFDDLVVSTGPVSFEPDSGAVDCAQLNPDWAQCDDALACTADSCDAVTGCVPLVHCCFVPNR